MSEAQHTVRVTHRFEASPERVFDAWLDPAKARRFLFTAPGGEIVRCEIDARVGGGFTIVDHRPDMGGDIEHVGEYLEIERPRRLVFTFAVPKFSAEFTVVTLEITPTATGCELSLLHEKVLPEWAHSTHEGWNMILGALAEAVRV